MEPVIYDLPIDSNLKNRNVHAAERGANQELETNPIFKKKVVANTVSAEVNLSLIDSFVYRFRICRLTLRCCFGVVIFLERINWKQGSSIRCHENSHFTGAVVSSIATLLNALGIFTVKQNSLSQ